MFVVFGDWVVFENILIEVLDMLFGGDFGVMGGDDMVELDFDVVDLDIGEMLM